MIDTLVRLHKVDAESAGLASLGKGPGYARRQVEGWTERYRRARTWNAPTFREVTAWLAANTPADVATCVIHNDFRFDNVVLDRADPTRVVGVLDWEMATLGDPLMDLGSSLAYWIEAGDDIVARATRRQPTHLPGMLTRSEVVDYYCDRNGPAHRRAEPSTRSSASFASRGSSSKSTIAIISGRRATPPSGTSGSWRTTSTGAAAASSAIAAIP